MRTLRTLASTLAVAAVILACAVVLAAASMRVQPARPYCPTEDSCAVDYRDGAWHVTEVTP